MDDAVNWLVLAVLAIIAALYDVGPLALWPVAPSAVVALAAWCGIKAGDREVLPRIWLIGIVTDAVDPGSVIFHAVVLVSSTLVLLPLRRFLFRQSYLAWALWAFCLVFMLALFDWGIGGGYPPKGGWDAIIASGTLTAVLVIPLGWLFDVLPPKIHPLGKNR